MFQHSLLLIYRNFQRFKSTFFINLIGLSTGMACALLIYLWVGDELSVDKFHEKADRLYQVMEHQQHAGSVRVIGSTPGLLAETLAEEIPEVEHAAVVTPFFWFEPFTLSIDENNLKATGQFASKDYFRMFSYDLIQGDASQVLSNKNAIVISEELAMKLFNTTENVVGKAIEFQHEREFLVAGIFKSPPANATNQFDFVLSFEVFKDINPSVLRWGNSGPDTYVLLKESADAAQFNNKIVDLIKEKHTDTHRTLFARPYADGYLYGNYENGVQAGGRIEYVRLFAIIAIFILIIACINFMNLSTAKASRRIKEVGIKKAVGASRKTLILQYLGESMLMTFVSLLIAIVLVVLLLPQFNQITGKQLLLVFDARLMLALIGIALLTGLMAGSYPALYLSGFNLVAVLKGGAALGKLNNAVGELWARKGLVVFQFMLSVILIVSVWVVYQQIAFVQNKNLGYDKDNIIYFEREGKLTVNLETFLSEMRNIPGIINASSIGQSMVGGGNTTSLDWEGKNPDDIIAFAGRPVNDGIIEMLGIEMAAGRSFSKKFSTDSSKIILNEAAIDIMGLEDPIGKVVRVWDSDMQIIGIVKDFHYESLREEVKPLFFVLKPEYTEKIIAKIEAGTEAETLARLQQFYQSYNPGFTFDYQFLDEEYQAQYVAEQRVATLSKYFAGIAILISCLGLFGLAAFTAERRMKEIGIRKILGSSDFGIVYLLSSDFTKMVLTAIVIALPLSYFIATKWLENFAYQIDLKWWYFIGAGLVALLIAWFTVGLQTVKAARINPAQCLKDE